MLKEINLTVLESKAAEGMSQANVAKAVGFNNDVALITRLKKDSAVLAAYNRGRAAAGKPLFGPKSNGNAKSAPAPVSRKMPKLSVQEQRVFEAIEKGISTRHGLTNETGLVYSSLEPILHNLTFEHCVVETWEDGASIEHYKLAGEATKPAAASVAKTSTNGRKKAKKQRKPRSTITHTGNPEPAVLAITIDNDSTQPETLDQVKDLCQQTIGSRVTSAESVLASVAVCLDRGDYFQAVLRLEQLKFICEFSELETKFFLALSKRLPVVMSMDNFVGGG